MLNIIIMTFLACLLIGLLAIIIPILCGSLKVTAFKAFSWHEWPVMRSNGILFWGKRAWHFNINW